MTLGGTRLVLEGRLDELVCVVVDEAHMVTDPERGLALEVKDDMIFHFSDLLQDVLMGRFFIPAVAFEAHVSP